VLATHIHRTDRRVGLAGVKQYIHPRIRKEVAVVQPTQREVTILSIEHGPRVRVWRICAAQAERGGGKRERESVLTAPPSSSSSSFSVGKPGGSLPVLPLSFGAGLRWAFAQRPRSRMALPASVSTAPSYGFTSSFGGKDVLAFSAHAFIRSSRSPLSFSSL
jgi:hypothetical protein